MATVEDKSNVLEEKTSLPHLYLIKESSVQGI